MNDNPLYTMQYYSREEALQWWVHHWWAIPVFIFAAASLAVGQEVKGLYGGLLMLPATILVFWLLFGGYMV